MSNHPSTNTDNNSALATIQSLPKAVRNLVAGGLAGMIAKSFVAPIDRIKILYQVTSAQFRLRDVPKVAYSIIEKEGWSALWKGNTATMIRVFPYSGIQFMVFDYCKHFYLSRDSRKAAYEANTAVAAITYADVAGKRHKDKLQNHGTIDNPHSNKTAQHDDTRGKGGLSPIDSLISGMAAGSISVLCTYPLDLARAQLAVLRKKKKPKDVLAAPNPARSKTNIDKLGIGSTSQSSRKGIGYVLSNGFQQGGLRGLYRGITPTVLGILPYSGAAFTINEQAKLKITRIMQREPTTIERLQCGALSGLFAQTLTYPLEVTRRRMQTVGIVPTSGSESAAVNFMGVTQLKPSMDELPAAEQQHQQRPQTELSSQQQKTITPSQNTTSTATTTANATATTTTSSSSQQKSTHKPPSMMKTMSHLLEEQGLRGFFKGVSMNWVKGPIAFSISFTAFDTIQGWIETESEKEKRRFSVQKRMTNKMERRITNHEDGD
eukprot:scaffold9817_cov154-Skeletonema_menzelii.AAC.9